MPEIIIYAVAGRPTEQKKRLMREVTRVVSESFEIATEHIVVQIVESPSTDKAKGGIPFDER